MEMTWSLPSSLMPRTPADSRPLNTRTSVTGKRMAWPSAVVSSTSLFSSQTATPMMRSPSSSFMAILPFCLTSMKSESLLRRTVPPLVANITSSLAQLPSSSGSGRMVVMFSSFASGRRLMSALPRACGAAMGKRHTFIL